MSIQLADRWKNRLAELVRFPPITYLMGWGIKLFVPRQRIGVALIVFNDNEEVLLLRHVFHPFTPWGPPGGWLGRHEAPDAGLIREVKEETGLDVVLGPVTSIFHESEHGNLVIGYTGWLMPGTIRLSNEIIEAQWFDRMDLPQQLTPFAKEAITSAWSRHSSLVGPNLVSEAIKY